MQEDIQKDILFEVRTNTALVVFTMILNLIILLFLGIWLYLSLD